MRMTTTVLLIAGAIAAGPALAQSNAGGTGASDVNPTAAGTAGTARDSGTLGTRRGDSVNTPAGREPAGATTGSSAPATGPGRMGTGGTPSGSVNSPDTPAARQSR